MNHTPDTIMNFGKYRGKQISSVPTSYLIWAVTNVFDSFDSDLEKSIYKEIVKRYDYEIKQANYHSSFDDVIEAMATEEDLY